LIHQQGVVPFLDFALTFADHFPKYSLTAAKRNSFDRRPEMTHNSIPVIHLRFDLGASSGYH
jgi:hypothetical protein